MYIKIIRGLAAILLPLLFLAGCGRRTAAEPAVKAVEEYCRIIRSVYIHHDLNPLAPVTTENELKRVFPVVLALRSSDNVMKTEIGGFTVKRSEFTDGGTKAVVETAEKWTFWWEDRKTGSVTKEKKTESYHLRYDLVNVNGHWKVDKVRNQ